MAIFSGISHTQAESHRVMTFANEEDVLSFRHHIYSKQGKEVALHEVGPRFEMQLYQLRLGTLDQVRLRITMTRGASSLAHMIYEGQYGLR